MKIKCIKCGHMQAFGEEWCEKCNTGLPDEEYLPSQAQEEKIDRKKSFPLPILMISSWYILLGILILFAATNRQEYGNSLAMLIFSNLLAVFMLATAVGIFFGKRTALFPQIAIGFLTVIAILLGTVQLNIFSILPIVMGCVAYFLLPHPFFHKQTK